MTTLSCTARPESDAPLPTCSLADYDFRHAAAAFSIELNTTHMSLLVCAATTCPRGARRADDCQPSCLPTHPICLFRSLRPRRSVRTAMAHEILMYSIVQSTPLPCRS